MSPIMLRQLWALVESTQSSTLLSLDDHSLIRLLLRQLGLQRSLNGDETQVFSHYIESRLPLIRDLAQNRAAV